MASRMIEVVGWEKFQHYKDRDPLWIKCYVDLLRRDEYMDLSPGRRSLLHGLWLLYASKRRALRDDTAMLSRELNQRVVSADLKALKQAGFIRIVASSTLAKRSQPASPEKEIEKERGLREESRAGLEDLKAQLWRNGKNVHDEVTV